MQSLPQLTDRQALARNRDRVRRSDNSAMFLHETAADEIEQRLLLVNRSFKSPAIVTPYSDQWANILPGSVIVSDSETLTLQQQAHDLVIHGLALHWANDPVGQLVQSRRALKPDGLFLAVLFGGQTLTELRTCLREAEAKVTGGLSPRVAPMGEIRDLGSVLQRAGFALPVADAITLTVSYDTALHLMRDLRAMGETNVLTDRNRLPLRRAVLDETVELYQNQFSTGGRITATFELIVLTGWAPSPDQPKPLRPGSANTRLADALNTQELPLDAGAKTSRV